LKSACRKYLWRNTLRYSAYALIKPKRHPFVRHARALVPGIHVFRASKTWMAGTKGPAMTGCASHASRSQEPIVAHRIRATRGPMAGSAIIRRLMATRKRVTASPATRPGCDCAAEHPA
jgi:hypothetical protein